MSLKVAALSALVVSALLAGASVGDAGRFTLRGKVIRVVTGNTLDVRLSNGKRTRVRVIGIDSPKRGECFYRQANARARSLANGNPLWLVGDRTQPTRDRFGRLLAYIAIRGRQDFGNAMLATGHARLLLVSRRFRRVASYRRIETLARNGRRGLWGTCFAPPPPPPPPPPPASVLTIVVDAVPDGSADFAFNIDGVGLSNVPGPQPDRGVCVLDDDTEATNSDRCLIGADNATLEVYERPISGFDLTQISCTSTGPRSAVTYDLANRKVTIAFAGTEDVTCVFTNTKSTAPPPAPPPPPPWSADVGVSKVASPDPAAVGQHITFTVTATNAGPAAAIGVQLVDEMPSALLFGVNLISATPTQGTCSSRGTSGGMLQTTCELGVIAAGASATLTFVVKATSGFTGGLLNSAFVFSNADPLTENNNVNMTTTVGGG